MKKLLFSALILIILLGCTKKEKADWTILIYMAADNSLYQAVIDEINEMETADFSDKINVIVQIDNHHEYGSFTNTRRYQILPENTVNREEITSPLIESLPDIDSGDYQEITNFANWGFRRFPSDKKALVIWSHGNGWYNLYNKFCPDNGTGNSVNIPKGDLKNALSSLDHQLDILIFDACNMQTMEVLAESYQYADYIIGSEESIEVSGFPYGDFEGNAILSIWEDYLETENLAIAIVNSFYESYLPGGSQNYEGDIFPVSCSVIKSCEFPDILDDITQFSMNWQEYGSISFFDETRFACYEFNDLQADVDIKEFFSMLKEGSSSSELSVLCEQILTNIDESILAQQFYNYPADDLGTASIWFPDEEQTLYNLIEIYQGLSFSQTNWQEFLSGLFSQP